MPDFLTNPLAIVGGLGATGLIVAFWGQLKSFFARVASRVIVTVEVNSGDLSRGVAAYLFANFKDSPFGTRSYVGYTYFVRSTDRYEEVAFELVGEKPKVFWRGWRFIWVQEVKPEEASGSGNRLVLRYIRGTFNADDLILAATDLVNDLKHGDAYNCYKVHYVRGLLANAQGRGGAVRVSTEDDDAWNDDPVWTRQHRLLRWTQDDLHPKSVSEDESPLRSLILSDDLRDAANEAQRWKASSKWYADHSVPWRRGWLLHGAPGTGKTTLARAVAEELNLPVYLYDLATMTNGELHREWGKMLANTPCMALIEDIDNIFDGRENLTRGGLDHYLTFDGLLNCIDGVERTDGLFLIVTTNKIDCIDPALSGVTEEGSEVTTRPGRIDRVLKLGSPNRAGLQRLAQRILRDYPELLEQAVADGFAAGDTIAQFQDRCTDRALALYWEGRTGGDDEASGQGERAARASERVRG